MKNLIKNLGLCIAYINKKINLSLLFMLSLITQCLILAHYSYDISLIRTLILNTPPFATLFFFVSYSFFFFEMNKRSYTKRDSKIRNISKLLQLPNIICFGAVVPLLFIMLYSPVFSFDYIWFHLPDLMFPVVLPFGNFVLNYRNQKDSENYIFFSKKKTNVCCH